MKQFTLLLLACFLLTGVLAAQEDAYHIEFSIDGYEQDILTIANHLLDQQYVIDTIERSPDGKFHFKDTTDLPKGIYLAVMAPDNNYFQFLVGNESPFFAVSGATSDLKRLHAEKSEENKNFYAYLAFLDAQKDKDAPIREALGQAGLSEEESNKLKAERQAIDAEVKAYQRKVLTEQAESFVAAIIRSNQGVAPPDFLELPEQERRIKQWRYMQKHFFDNIDLHDDRLLRTPFLFERVDYFVHKLHVQHPDSLSIAIDKVLQMMRPESDLFKMYLIHFLNEAAGSELVGMDAIYVHLIDNYYSKGLAPWTEAEQMTKFKANADRLRPLLIGKQAPDIKMEKRDGTNISLYDVDTEYTVLYFWRYDCGHCKESTPVMQEFYEKWKDRGVTLFAVCAKVGDEVPPCWEYIDEKEINDWLHTIDPYLRSRYPVLYDVQQTPAIFVLDKDKTIISKRLGAEQLDDLLNRIEERKAAEAAASESNGE